MKNRYIPPPPQNYIIPLIIYEDNHIIAAVKPPNIPSQADASGDADFLTIIKRYVKEKYKKPGDAYIGLVHRLDRPAGGIMVFARTSKAAARLSSEMKNGLFKKKYLAVIKNTQGLKDAATLTNFLVKDKNKNTSSVVSEGIKDAKYAELNYRVLEKKDRKALAEIELKTGRPHQIRAQMSHIGAPLYGDYRYGGVKEGNLALWAYMLRFTHPVKREEFCFICPPPDEKPWTEFENAINALKPEINL